MRAYALRIGKEKRSVVRRVDCLEYPCSDQYLLNEPIMFELTHEN